MGVVAVEAAEAAAAVEMVAEAAVTGPAVAVATAEAAAMGEDAQTYPPGGPMMPAPV